MAISSSRSAPAARLIQAFKEAGIDPAPSYHNSKSGSASRNIIEQQDAAARMKKYHGMPWWCGDSTLHERDPAGYRSRECCCKHMLGLSRHPKSKRECPPAPFHVEFQQEVEADSPLISDLSDPRLRDPHMYIVNKARQIGMTEAVLDIIAWLCISRFGPLAEQGDINIAIIAGTNGGLAQANLRRLARAFEHQPWMVSQWPSGGRMVLANGIVIQAFKAAEESVTGLTDFKVVFMDEAAKWRLVEDQPVFDSILPIVRTNAAYFFLVSTPKGPVKMYYEIWSNPGKYPAFKRLSYFIDRTRGNMHTDAEIAELERGAENVGQEYHGKFITPKDSLYGEITDHADPDSYEYWGDDVGVLEEDEEGARTPPPADLSGEWVD